MSVEVVVLVDGDEIEVCKLSDDELWVLYRRLEVEFEYHEVSRKLLNEIHFRERIEAYSNLLHES